MGPVRILLKEIGLRKLLNAISWYRAVNPQARGFYVSRCLEGLEICGCLDILRSQGSLNLDKFLNKSEATDYNKGAIEVVCDYLYEVGILSKKGLSYSLTKKGKRLCLNRHGSFDFIEAYGQIFHELPDILMGRKYYGKDIFRKDRYVAKATAEISEWLPLPVFRYLIRKYKLQKILDLGCGRGELLLSLAKTTDLQDLRGIDINKESLSDGIQRIKQAGLDNRIFLKSGDIKDPSPWADWLKNADAVTAMFVLHEFLAEGENEILSILKNLKSLSSRNTAILIAELPLQTPDQVRKLRTATAEHFLFHWLSNQRILEANQLRNIIHKAGLTIIEDLHFTLFCQHYILARC